MVLPSLYHGSINYTTIWYRILGFSEAAGVSIGESNPELSSPVEKQLKADIKHLNLRDVKRKSRPTANARPLTPASYPIPPKNDPMVDSDSPVEACL